MTFEATLKEKVRYYTLKGMKRKLDKENTMKYMIINIYNWIKRFHPDRVNEFKELEVKREKKY